MKFLRNVRKSYEIHGINDYFVGFHPKLTLVLATARENWKN